MFNKIKPMVRGNKFSILMALAVMMTMIAGGAGTVMGQEETLAAEIVTDDGDILAGDSGTFSVNLDENQLTDADVDSYTWSMVDADGNSVTLDSSSGAEITHAFQSAGEYTLSVDVATADGSTYSDEYTVSVSEVYTLTADATLDGEVVAADFTLDETTQTGESVTYDVSDGEKTISAEYVVEEENEDGEMEEVTYTASDAVDMDSSDQSVTLELTEDNGVIGGVVESGEGFVDSLTSSISDVLDNDKTPVVIAFIIIIVLIAIAYRWIKSAGNATDNIIRE